MSHVVRALVLLVIGLTLPHRLAAGGLLSLSDYNHQGVTGWFDGVLTTEYGGRITATFDGKALPHVFCVEAFNDIGLSTYESTIDGGGSIHGHLVPHAGEIAWLMTMIAPSVGADPDKLNGLQGALWNLSAPTGHSFAMSPSVNPDAFAWYSSYLAAGAGQSAPLGSLSWISAVKSDLSDAQGLVSLNTFVPVPEGPVGIAAALLLGGLAMLRGRRPRSPLASDLHPDEGPHGPHADREATRRYVGERRTAAAGAVGGVRGSGRPAGGRGLRSRRGGPTGGSGTIRLDALPLLDTLLPPLEGVARSIDADDLVPEFRRGHVENVRHAAQRLGPPGVGHCRQILAQPRLRVAALRRVEQPELRVERVEEVLEFVGRHLRDPRVELRLDPPHLGRRVDPLHRKPLAETGDGHLPAIAVHDVGLPGEIALVGIECSPTGRRLGDGGGHAGEAHCPRDGERRHEACRTAPGRVPPRRASWGVSVAHRCSSPAVVRTQVTGSCDCSAPVASGSVRHVK